MSPSATEPPPTAAAGPADRPPTLADLDRRPPPIEPESTRWLRDLDGVLLVAGTVLRALIYIVIFAIADHWSFGPSMLSGLVAGDLVACVGTLAWDWQQRSTGAVIELLAVAVFATWWWCRHDTPSNPELQAIAMLSALGGFVVRTSAHAIRAFSWREGI